MGCGLDFDVKQAELMNAAWPSCERIASWADSSSLSFSWFSSRHDWHIISIRRKTNTLAKIGPKTCHCNMSVTTQLRRSYTKKKQKRKKNLQHIHIIRHSKGEEEGLRFKHKVNYTIVHIFS